MMKKNGASASSGSAINSNKDAEGGGSSHKVDGGSVFHAKLRTNACETSMNETMGSMKNYVDALVQFCCAGHQTADQLANLLSPTIYSEIARQFVVVTKEVETAVKMEGAQVKADAEMFWSQLGRSYEGENNNKTSTVSQDVELIAKSLLRMMQTHCQFFLTTSEVLAQFAKVNSLEDLSNSQALSPEDGLHLDNNEKTNLYSMELGQNPDMKSTQSADSPSRLRKHISSFFSKKLGKSSGSGPIDGPQSSFYVQTPEFLKDIEAGSSQSIINNGAANNSVKPKQVDNNNVTAGQMHSREYIQNHAGAGPLKGTETKTTGGNSSNKNTTEALLMKAVGSGIPGQSSGLGKVEKGHLASQEELDSVIDLLSGLSPKTNLQKSGRLGPPHLEGLPPKPPSAQHFIGAGSHLSSKAVGSHLNTPSGLKTGAGPAGFPSHLFSHPPPPLPGDGSSDNPFYGNRAALHRRSDGLIGETLNRANQKTNTWPYRPQHRAPDYPLVGATGASTLPGSNTLPTFPPTTGAYDGHTNDAEYSRYLAAVRHMKTNVPPIGPPNNFPPPNNPWSTGEGSLNRSWPMHMFPQDGHDSSVKMWPPGIGDSTSSCSDESSNGGEVPWMMGLDLVNAMERRRHSSGEESFPIASAAAASADPRPHSVEDLLEPKAANTWPVKQQQPWPKGAPGQSFMETNPIPNTLHPPLQMQWSDPLTNRSLTAWGTGVAGAVSQQSLQMYAGLPVGVPDQLPQTSHLNMDNTFPILS